MFPSKTKGSTIGFERQGATGIRAARKIAMSVMRRALVLKPKKRARIILSGIATSSTSFYYVNGIARLSVSPPEGDRNCRLNNNRSNDLYMLGRSVWEIY